MIAILGSRILNHGRRDVCYFCREQLRVRDSFFQSFGSGRTGQIEYLGDFLAFVQPLLVCRRDLKDRSGLGRSGKLTLLVFGWG